MSKSNKIIGRLAAVAAFCLVSFFGHSAFAATFSFCMKAEVLNEDSNWTTYTGVKEDNYLTPGPSPEVFRARGIYVDIHDQWGNFITGGFTNQNGCGVITGGSLPMNVIFRAYTVSQPGNGNTLWVHNGGDSIGIPPGSPYEWWVGATLNPGLSTDVVIPYTDQFSAFVTGSWVMYYINQGVSGKTFNMGFSTAGSSAHYGTGYANLSIGQGYARIAIDRVDYKFVIAHELGHLFALLHRGVNAFEPVNYAYSGSQNCPTPPVPDYTIDSAEWSNTVHSEAFAQFYATRVFNNRYHSDAAYFEGTSSTNQVSAEFFSTCTPDPPGGRTDNVCFDTFDCFPPTGSPTSGVTTNGDWLRWNWDIFTKLQAACGDETSFGDMLDLYTKVVDLTPAQDEFQDEVGNAAVALSNFSNCDALEITAMGVANGTIN